MSLLISASLEIVILLAVVLFVLILVLILILVLVVLLVILILAVLAVLAILRIGVVELIVVHFLPPRCGFYRNASIKLMLHGIRLKLKRCAAFPRTALFPVCYWLQEVVLHIREKICRERQVL